MACKALLLRLALALAVARAGAAPDEGPPPAKEAELCGPSTRDNATCADDLWCIGLGVPEKFKCGPPLPGPPAPPKGGVGAPCGPSTPDNAPCADDLQCIGVPGVTQKFMCEPPLAGPRMRRLRGGPAANCSGAVPGQAGCEPAREPGGASGQCVASGNKCGYNGNPWCSAGNQDKCCCDFGYCAPRLGNAEGIIDMQCYPADKCVSPAEDPSQALCGAGGQQQIPCCDDAVCLPIAGSEGESGGGVLMACVRPITFSTTPGTPSTSGGTCEVWNMPCDYYNTCCDGYQCTWANTDPEPSTICLAAGADLPGPEGSCAAKNEPCDYHNTCCETYTCTWANTDPETSTICL